MTIKAAGAVLWRRRGDRLEVAVVHRPRHDDWSLPKGKLDGDETMREAAQREVHEETGHRAILGAPLGEVCYEVSQAGVRRPKTVRYWAMEAVDGRFSPTVEVDELRWLATDEARRLLSYDLDREVLDRFMAGHELQAPM